MKSNNTYQTASDYTLGCILALASVAGAIMNIGAFLFYRRNRSRNHVNREYFRRLFSIITANDVVVCLSVFPVIDAAFSEERQGFLFAQHWFCRGWFVVWHTVWQISMAAVAMMSLSRLLVIRKPNCHLRPCVVYAFIASLLVCILVYWVTAICLEMVFPRYYPGYMYCGVSLFRDIDGKVDPPFVIKHDTGFLVRKGIISVTTCSILISFLTVTSTFILSLIYLRASKSTAHSIGISATRQYKAARTVIIFTFTTIVASTPIMMVGMWMTVEEITNPLDPGSTGADVMLRMSFNDHPVLEQYAWPVAMVLATCLNSMINPVIYYWRMRGFRTFVNGTMRDNAQAVRRRMSSMPSMQGVVRGEEHSLKDIEKLRMVVSQTDPGKSEKDKLSKLSARNSC